MCEVKKDCFAYREKNGREYCSALRYLFCRGEECNWYKKKGEECKGCPHENKGVNYHCIRCKEARKGV